MSSFWLVQVSSCAWKYASKVMPGKEPVDAARAGLDFLKLRENKAQTDQSLPVMYIK